MAGSWGMIDEQYAAARYRRRQALIAVGFAIASAGQLASYFAADGSILAMLSWLGFACCSGASVVSWRRGRPDTRPPSKREPKARPTAEPGP